MSKKQGEVVNVSSWNFDPPLGTFKNHALSEELYKHYCDRAVAYKEVLLKWDQDRHVYQGHTVPFGPECQQCYPKPTLVQQALRWFAARRPHIHLGPCPDSED
jgi:hypothetical protein